MHLDPKCNMNRHKCDKLCISQNCSVPNPFVCSECKNHHKSSCILIEYKELVSKLHKKQGMNKRQLFKYEQYVEDTFRVLMKSLRAEFINFREQYEHINASNRIVQFYQLVKSHKENSLTGSKVYEMIHQQFPLKNKYVLKTQATMWSLSKELVELQKKVNSKLPYYYSLYEKDEEDNTINEISFEQKDKSIKDIEMKFRLYRNKLKGYIIDDHLTVIQGFFDRDLYNIQPLFRASKHDFSAEEFHKACDGKVNTLMIAKTEYNKLVGAFCAVPWRSPKSWQYQQDPSNKTFLFSLGRQFKNLKFEPFKKKFSIGMHRDYGPCFGDDLVIYDKSNTSKNCWSNFPDCYRCKTKEVPHNQYTIQEWVGVTDHYKKFNIIEWEVYKISFNKQEEQERSFMDQYRKI